jgi:hypothetical protein
MDKPEEEQQLTDNTAEPVSCAYHNAAILKLQRKLTEWVTVGE